MAGPDGLVEWLRAQLDADERMLVECSHGCTCDDLGPQRPDCQDRLHQDIAAKRAILHAHDRPHECVQLTGSGERSVVDGQPWKLWEAEHTSLSGGVCHTIRLLATVYADREGYDPTWRPE